MTDGSAIIICDFKNAEGRGDYEALRLYISRSWTLFSSYCLACKASRKELPWLLERRSHIGGNIYCEEIEGINVHKYGAHIFHTSHRKVWDFVNSFVEFNRYTNSPVANYKGEIYNMPFNMNTFSRMWGISTPQEAKAIIDKQKSEITGEPKNLEEQAIALVGRDIYEKLVKGYTEKQWGRDCSELPSFIIKTSSAV